MKFTLPRIYPITDRNLSGLSHAEQTRQFIAGGATLIQLRDKTASSRDLYEDALAAVRIAHERGVRILINDRVDIAFMTNADGVHVGQDDLPPDAARHLLGEKAIVGISTHSVDQVKHAAMGKIADYIAFGPIFETPTKADHEPLVGLETLAEIRRISGYVPLAAIGGIKADHLSGVFSAGADSAAMISELYLPNQSISTRYRQLCEMAETTNNVVLS